MKKVIVIGCPGSGKSTFSRALHEAMETDTWIIDGNFASTLTRIYLFSEAGTEQRNIFCG